MATGAALIDAATASAPSSVAIDFQALDFEALDFETLDVPAFGATLVAAPISTRMISYPRWKMVLVLLEGPRSASELVDLVGLNKATVSHHVQVLVKSKLVAPRLATADDTLWAGSTTCGPAGML